MGPERPGARLPCPSTDSVRSPQPPFGLALGGFGRRSIHLCLSVPLENRIGLAGAGPASVVERGAAQFGRVVLLTGVGERGSTLSRRQAPADGCDGRRFPLDIATLLIRRKSRGKLDTWLGFDPILNDAHGGGYRPQPLGPPSLVGLCCQAVNRVVLAALRPSLCAGLGG